MLIFLRVNLLFFFKYSGQLLQKQMTSSVGTNIWRTTQMLMGHINTLIVGACSNSNDSFWWVNSQKTRSTRITILTQNIKNLVKPTGEIWKCCLSSTPTTAYLSLWNHAEFLAKAVNSTMHLRKLGPSELTSQVRIFLQPWKKLRTSPLIKHPLIGIVKLRTTPSLTDRTE